MKVVEVFKSLQGEGPHQGEEAVFIRLAYCNLFCKWCDTKYAWHPTKAKWLGFGINVAQPLDLNPRELIKVVMEVADNVKHVVITGGEPLLWRGELIEVVRYLKVDGWFVEIETNGTIGPGELLSLVDEFNVSIKLSNSGVPERFRIVNNVIREFINSGNSIFKFVINSWDDYNEVLGLITRFNIPKNRVYLMSQCASRGECLSKDEEVVKPMALKLGVKFTTRLQIINGFK